MALVFVRTSRGPDGMTLEVFANPETGQTYGVTQFTHDGTWLPLRVETDAEGVSMPHPIGEPCASAAEARQVIERYDSELASCYVCGVSTKAVCLECSRPVCREHFDYMVDSTKQDRAHALCADCARANAASGKYRPLSAQDLMRWSAARGSDRATHQ